MISRLVVMFLFLPALSFCQKNNNELNESILLTLSSEDSIVWRDNSVLNLHVELINHTEDDLVILNRTAVSASGLLTYNWRICVLYEDSTKMIYPEHYFDEAKMPSLNEYLMVSKNNKFVFDFTLDFKEFATDISKFLEENKRFGYYYLQIYYHDTYCIHYKALDSVIKSNKLRIRYLE